MLALLSSKVLDYYSIMSGLASKEGEGVRSRKEISLIRAPKIKMLAHGSRDQHETYPGTSFWKSRCRIQGHLVLKTPTQRVILRIYWAIPSANSSPGSNWSCLGNSSRQGFRPRRCRSTRLIWIEGKGAHVILAASMLEDLGY